MHPPVADRLPQSDESRSTSFATLPAPFISLALPLDLRATRLQFLDDVPSRCVLGRLAQERERFVVLAGRKQLPRSFTDLRGSGVTRLPLEPIPLVGRKLVSLPGHFNTGCIQSPRQLDVISSEPDGIGLLEPANRFVGSSGNQGLLGRRHQPVDLASTLSLFVLPSFLLCLQPLLFAKPCRVRLRL